jgi:hypothetical protein
VSHAYTVFVCFTYCLPACFIVGKHAGHQAGIDIDSAPESGTVREAAYPFDRDHSATESDEENRKQ